jgi:hypothetical protein
MVIVNPRKLYGNSRSSNLEVSYLWIQSGSQTLGYSLEFYVRVWILESRSHHTVRSNVARLVPAFYHIFCNLYDTRVIKYLSSGQWAISLKLNLVIILTEQ